MSVDNLIKEIVRLFEDKKLDEAIAKLNQAWDEIEDKNSQIKEQNDIQWWLGRCCLEQAIKTKDVVEAMSFFAQAIMYFQEQLKLAEQLTDEQTRIQQQIYAQAGLGRCYLEQAIKIKDNSQKETLIKDAEGYFLGSLELLPQFDDEKEKYQIEKIICYHLRNICFLISSKWNLYFDKKKQEICETLFLNKDNELNEKLKGSISTILAVLHIPPIELGSTPLAHYTSSTVCNKLFGVVNEDAPSPMRIGSSTYMNDPSEGKGLLELLKLQDLELENKEDCSSHNAFFACFSSRVNDLNQFRLYGKEDGVEASDCCLVFNKNGDWLKEPDISAPFRSFIKNQDENSATFKKTDLSNVKCENLPLYQVAYIAYKDDYITEEKCGIWLNDSKFGICLKPIGENNEWHNFRIEKLEEALQQLIDFFKVKDNVNDQNKNVLEYIRYLFKDFAFRDEEEFRVLKMAEIGSEEIKYCKTTKSIYLPYADISNVVDEVILGTNYEKTNSRHKAEVFQHEMKRKYPYVDVSRSSLPIYANPPIKKD
ncbi:sel1 repeat family protein [Aggregatibacter aphrophilus]|uniref:sel1 repeat family protein n=1 Tax=Aggregatibacter aphrophilus TaxID=732 RepID=UPI001EF49940|nr:sel1 repeat family protein [Aggregatibacter aphrophilus]